MKKCFYVLLLVLPLCRCGMMHDNPGRVCVAFVFDLTDSLEATMDVDTADVRRLLPIDHNPKLGAWVRLSYISDVKTTEAYIHELDSHSTFGSNGYERAGESKRFYAAIMNDVHAITSKVEKRKQSYVFHQIIASMDALAGCNDCTRKLCLIISDCAENSPSFSSYKPADKVKLNNSPDVIMADIEKEYPQSKRYNGVEIVFVHKGTVKNDENFWRMYTKVLSPYLTGYGARVFTVGSLREIR